MDENIHSKGGQHPTARRQSDANKKNPRTRLIQPELFSDADFQEPVVPQTTLEKDSPLPENQRGLKRDDERLASPKVDGAGGNEAVITIVDTDHKSMGQILSEARTHAGLTIENVANETHIRSDYVRFSRRR